MRGFLSICPSRSRGHPEFGCTFYFLLSGGFERGLGGGQTCDRNALGRARNVVQAQLVVELDGIGIAAVFAANARKAENWMVAFKNSRSGLEVPVFVHQHLRAANQ